MRSSEHIRDVLNRVYAHWSFTPRKPLANVLADLAVSIFTDDEEILARLCTEPPPSLDPNGNAGCRAELLLEVGALWSMRPDWDLGELVSYLGTQWDTPDEGFLAATKRLQATVRADGGIQAPPLAPGLP